MPKQNDDFQFYVSPSLFLFLFVCEYKYVTVLKNVYVSRKTNSRTKATQDHYVLNYTETRYLNIASFYNTTKVRAGLMGLKFTC